MSLLTGILSSTLLKTLLSTLVDVLKGILFQISWKVVLERFATRIVIWGLEKLKNLSTNDVVDSTVEDIIKQLQGKRLKELPAIQKDN